MPPSDIAEELRARARSGPEVVVLGQVARDLVLLVEKLPEAGMSAPVLHRREMLGGKGANQAVALTQLGLRAGLVGVLGDDVVGDRLLDAARADDIDVRHVVRRSRTGSGLIVEVLDRAARWRYLEDLPADVLLGPRDIQPALASFADAHTVVVQLQQPADAALAAAVGGRERGCRVVLDGAPGDRWWRDSLLAAAHVVRADHREAEMLWEREITGPEAAVQAARDLRTRGPEVVVLGAGDAGNAVAWDGGDCVVPLLDVEVVDTTGGGDAFVAGLVAGLARGGTALEAAKLGTAAAALTVVRPGGRPELDPDALQEQLRRLDRACPGGGAR